MNATANEQARFNMVEQQVRPWEVLDPTVLDLMGRMPREAFVPDKYKGLAYADIEIPLGEAEQMMFPRIEGRLLQALNLQPSDKVLEIGTGSGFLAACMAELADNVISVDIDPNLAEQASKCLRENGIDNVQVDSRDGLIENAEDHAYDAIALTGSVASLPEFLKRKLTIGGRLFAVIGSGSVMEATLITRTGEDSWDSESLFETDMLPLKGGKGAATFVF
jgi:protein-L-isoaspartate(D-aspartate) O-methyltransferase